MGRRTEQLQVTLVGKNANQRATEEAIARGYNPNQMTPLARAAFWARFGSSQVKFPDGDTVIIEEPVLHPLSKPALTANRIRRQNA